MAKFLHLNNLLALATVAQLTMAGIPARAEDGQGSSRMVQTSDLDLHTAAGAAALRHRVAVAARGVCGPTEMVGAPEYNIYDHCVTEAQAQAQVKASAMIAAVQGANRFALGTPTN